MMASTIFGLYLLLFSFSAVNLQESPLPLSTVVRTGSNPNFQPSEIITDVSMTTTSAQIQTQAQSWVNPGLIHNVRITVIIFEDGQERLGENRAGKRIPNQQSTNQLSKLKPNSWYGFHFENTVTQGQNISTYSLYFIRKTLAEEGQEPLSLNLNVVPYYLSAPRYGHGKVHLRAQADEPTLSIFHYILRGTLRCSNTSYSTQKSLYLTQETPGMGVTFDQMQTATIEYPEVPLNVSDHLNLYPGQIASISGQVCEDICYEKFVQSRFPRIASIFPDISIVPAYPKEICQSILSINRTVPIKTVSRVEVNMMRITVYPVDASRDDAVSVVANISVTASPLSPNCPGTILSRQVMDSESIGFNLTNLSKGCWYILQYDYNVMEPVSYGHTESSLVWIPNVTDPTQFTEAARLIKIDITSTRKGRWFDISLERESIPELSGREVHLTLLPFCGEDGAKFNLTNESVKRQYYLNISEEAVEFSDPPACEQICYIVEIMLKDKGAVETDSGNSEQMTFSTGKMCQLVNVPQRDSAESSPLPTLSFLTLLLFLHFFVSL